MSCIYREFNLTAIVLCIQRGDHNPVTPVTEVPLAHSNPSFKANNNPFGCETIRSKRNGIEIFKLKLVTLAKSPKASTNTVSPVSTL